MIGGVGEGLKTDWCGWWLCVAIYVMLEVGDGGTELVKAGPMWVCACCRAV